MSFELQDTARATLWHNMNVLTGIAHTSAREEEGDTQTSVSTWLQAVCDSDRQTLGHAQNAAKNPLLGRGVTDENFKLYVDRVLLGRVPTKDLEDLEDYFRDQFWPLEEAWRKFRKKPNNRSYAGVMEDLLKGERLRSLTKDLERLVAWSKQRLHDAYMSNQYADAAEAADAILWQLGHIWPHIPEKNRGLYAIAAWRIAFYAGLIKKNCQHRLPLTVPFEIKGIKPTPAEDLAISIEATNYRSLLENDLLLTGNIGRFTTFNHDLTAILTIALQHRIAALKGIISSQDINIIVPLSSQFPDKAEFIRRKCEDKIKNDDFIISSYPGTKNLPAWLIDPDLRDPLSVNAARWLRTIYATWHLRALSQQQKSDYVAKRMMLMADCIRAYWSGLYRGSPLMHMDDSPFLSLEMQRTALTVDTEVAAKGVLKVVQFVANTDHHATWSEAYLACGEYFSQIGNQYGAVQAQKKAILAIETLDNACLKKEMEVEERRLKLNPMPHKKEPTTETEQILDFVEAAPAFLLRKNK